MTDQLLNNGFPLDTFYPPNETVDAWAVKYEGHMPHWVLRHLAAEAAQWGADQQLTQDATWLDLNSLDTPHLKITPIGKTLIAAMRPKPPSLRKLACDALDTYIYGDPNQDDKVSTYNTIRKALEELPND